MKNVLIVGSGAREVALARSGSKSLVENSIFCVSKDINPQIQSLCKNYFVSPLDEISEIVGFCQNMQLNHFNFIMIARKRFKNLTEAANFRNDKKIKKHV